MNYVPSRNFSDTFFFNLTARLIFHKTATVHSILELSRTDVYPTRPIRFISNTILCSTLFVFQTNIPLVFIQGDSSTALTRELASLMRSVATATVPKITLITGKTSGHAYLAMVCFHTIIRFLCMI